MAKRGRTAPRSLALRPCPRHLAVPPFELALMFTIYEEIESRWAKVCEDIRLSEDERGTFTAFISDEEKEARTEAIVAD